MPQAPPQPQEALNVPGNVIPNLPTINNRQAWVQPWAVDDFGIGQWLQQPGVNTQVSTEEARLTQLPTAKLAICFLARHEDLNIGIERAPKRHIRDLEAQFITDIPPICDVEYYVNLENIEQTPQAARRLGDGYEVDAEVPGSPQGLLKEAQATKERCLRVVLGLIHDNNHRPLDATTPTPR